MGSGRTWLSARLLDTYAKPVGRVSVTTAWVAPLTVMVATTGPPPAATDPVSNSLVALGSVPSWTVTMSSPVTSYSIRSTVSLPDDGFPPLRRSPCR